MNKRGFSRYGLILLLVAGTALGQEAVSLTRPDNKPVPVIAYPSKDAGCRGIAIISPGAGGSETGYAYLGEAMSSLGYLSVVVGHQESGRRALRKHMHGNGLRDGLEDLITDPAAYRGRFMDLAAAREWARSKCAAADAILIGHSMGAATAMIEAGARNNLGVAGSDAFSAYIALSPQGVGSIFPHNAWTNIKRPVLSITGTRDNELGGASLETRTEPYMAMPPGCKWLAVIDGASHMSFAGRGMSRQAEALTGKVIGDYLEARHHGECRAPMKSRGMQIQAK